MKVNSVTYSTTYFPDDNIRAIEKSLKSIADQNRTTVDAYIEQAKAAGDSATTQQVRAINLSNRLSKLKESE